MNIKITKDDHTRLCVFPYKEYAIGSHLWDKVTDESDTDFLRVYTPPSWWSGTHVDCYPNIHQFQYTEDNVDYIWTTGSQFAGNLVSGDSTINAEITLFLNPEIKPENKLQLCRTKKVIKGFLGFAKRDLKAYKGKEAEKKRAFHANRGLFIAGELLKGLLPELSVVQYMRWDDWTYQEMVDLEKHLRKKMNDQFDARELENYFIDDKHVGDKLLMKMLKANNIREFKYG